MFCKKCGKNIKDSAVFCPHCGTQMRKSAGSSGYGGGVGGLTPSFDLQSSGFICEKCRGKRIFSCWSVEQ